MTPAAGSRLRAAADRGGDQPRATCSSTRCQAWTRSLRRRGHQPVACGPWKGPLARPLSGYRWTHSRIRVPHGQQASVHGRPTESKALPRTFGLFIRLGRTTASSSQAPRPARCPDRAAIGTGGADDPLDARHRDGRRSSSHADPSGADQEPSRPPRWPSSHSDRPVRSGPGSRRSATLWPAPFRAAPRNVTVADLNGRVYHASNDNDQIGNENLYADIVQMHERELKTKVGFNALSFIPKVTVEATVVLDTKQSGEGASPPRSITRAPRPMATDVSDKSKTRQPRDERATAAGRAYKSQEADMPTSLAGGSRPHTHTRRKKTDAPARGEFGLGREREEKKRPWGSRPSW